MICPVVVDMALFKTINFEVRGSIIEDEIENGRIGSQRPGRILLVFEAVHKVDILDGSSRSRCTS